MKIRKPIEEHNLCPWEFRLIVGRPYLQKSEVNVKVHLCASRIVLNKKITDFRFLAMPAPLKIEFLCYFIFFKNVNNNKKIII